MKEIFATVVGKRNAYKNALMISVRVNRPTNTVIVLITLVSL